MSEEQIIKLTILTIKTRISYLERMIYEIGGNGPTSAEILQAEIDCLCECLHWLFEKARDNNYEFYKWYVMEKASNHD